MDLNPYAFDPIANSMNEVVKLILLIGFVAIPLGWILACFTLWRPLPHLFAILSRWFVGIHVLMSALVLFALGSSIEGIRGAEALPLGILAGSVSGMLAWIIVGRRSRAPEQVPSLL